MAWESRGNKSYYYRKKRQGDRVVSEYIGNDSSAAVISELDRLERKKLFLKQAEWRVQELEFREIEAELEHLNETVELLLHATLLTSGYHPHKGQWRKKRYG